MVQKIVTASQTIIFIPILAILLAALGLLGYGAVTVVTILWSMLSTAPSVVSAKHFSVAFIELIDLLLLGTVLYIIALGLYDLFGAHRVKLPNWLHVRSLDDLKDKLVGVIVILLSVTFLGDAVEESGGKLLLEEGISIAVVIAALGFSRFVSHRSHGPISNEPDTDPTELS